MKVNNQALIAHRRLQVEKLTLRGLSQREILRVFEQQRIVNPQTGDPWSLATINGDVQALETQWDTAAIELKRKQKARVAAELREAKKVAWADRDFRLVRDLLKDEAALFNLSDPIDVNVKFGGQVDVVHSLDASAQEAQELETMSEDELDDLIMNLLAGSGVDYHQRTHSGMQVIEGELVDMGDDYE